MHLTATELASGIDLIRSSPVDGGTVEMIVCRPDVDRRKEVQTAELDIDEGLVGDNWLVRGSRSMPDGEADPARQITLMNARCISLLARERSRWELAGDQLYVDLDLSVESLPAGSRLQLGSAVVEVSEEPHTGCGKFSKRFGVDALRFVNSVDGKHLRLRGLNARVVRSGRVRRGDDVLKVPRA